MYTVKKNKYNQDKIKILVLKYKKQYRQSK